MNQGQEDNGKNVNTEPTTGTQQPAGFLLDMIGLQKSGPPPITRKQLALSISLFLLTVVTTTFIGGLTYIEFYELDPGLDSTIFWIGGLTYSVPVMTILLAHEMGHFLTARRYNMVATPPYFIPAPTLIGTFGAFIKIKSPFFGKRDLFDVGIAGPIAGFVVAVPVLIIGMFLSRIIHVPPESTEFISFGEPILFKLLQPLIFPPLHKGAHILLHPVAFAGWIGMLVTSLNLLPVGQLDGGHIAYAVLGRKAHLLSYGLIGILLIFALFYEGWLIWVILLLILGLRHPPIPYDYVPLDKTRKRLAWLALVIFILSFMPIPVNL